MSFEIRCFKCGTYTKNTDYKDFLYGVECEYCGKNIRLLPYEIIVLDLYAEYYEGLCCDEARFYNDENNNELIIIFDSKYEKECEFKRISNSLNNLIKILIKYKQNKKYILY